MWFWICKVVSAQQSTYTLPIFFSLSMGLTCEYDEILHHHGVTVLGTVDLQKGKLYLVRLTWSGQPLKKELASFWRYLTGGRSTITDLAEGGERKMRTWEWLLGTKSDLWTTATKKVGTSDWQPLNSANTNLSWGKDFKFQREMQLGWHLNFSLRDWALTWATPRLPYRPVS